MAPNRRGQPFQFLPILWRVGEQIAGISKRQSPEFLQLSPYGNAKARTSLGQAKDNQEP